MTPGDVVTIEGHDGARGEVVRVTERGAFVRWDSPPRGIGAGWVCFHSAWVLTMSCLCVCWRCIASKPDHVGCEHACALLHRETVGLNASR